MNRMRIMNFGIGLVLGVFVEAMYGLIISYTPLKPSMFLYLTSCGGEPIANISMYCKYINMLVISFYDLVNLLPAASLVAFIVIRVQSSFFLISTPIPFVSGFLVSLAVLCYFVPFNPFSSFVVFYFLVVDYGCFIAVYLLLHHFAKRNTLHDSSLGASD
jgi:hypothetical protein